MIQDEDVHFHKADAGVPNWAETNFFGFFNAEATLNIGVYVISSTGDRAPDLHEFGVRQHSLGSRFLRFAGLDAHPRTA
jgi:hypothetical protein